MNMLSTATKTVTMTSLELVDFINSQRKEGEPVLTHADFMKKVPKVLSEKDTGIFSDIYFDAYGREQRCYKFPKRESCLMAMSYSYEIQAKVFDRMTELEKQIALKLPTNYKEALLALVQAEEQKELLVIERDHAIATKAQINDAKTATAMNTASQAVKRANKLQAELGRCVENATIIAVKKLTGTEYAWQPLRKWCKAQGVKAIEVVDARYGLVKSWPSAAWVAVHGVDLAAIF